MKKKIRQEKIYHQIKKTGEVSVKELARLLNVSEMTIRRDLMDLESLHDTEPKKASQTEYDLLTALKKEHQKKFRIGEKAASLIEDHETIIIDTGSTTSKIIPYLDDEKQPTILTYNSHILKELLTNSQITLKFCGGDYHPETGMFESPESIAFLKKHRATKYFASASGIHESLGVTCINTYETAIKQASLDSSLEVILMVDASKFGILSPAVFCDLKQIHTVITDDGLSQEWVSYLEEIGITLYMV